MESDKLRTSGKQDGEIVKKRKYRKESRKKRLRGKMNDRKVRGDDETT